jgi:hypothetical protein
MRIVCSLLIVASLSLPVSAQGLYWVPVAAHSEGVGGSVWRTDVGILNPHQGPATVEIRLRNSGNVWTMAVTIPGGAEHVVEDVVGQLVGGDGQGSLEVVSDVGVNVTSRTYNQTAGGTFGQSLDGLSSRDGVTPGRRALLGPLQENADFRTNVGVLNMGSELATARVQLFDSSGVEIGSYDLVVPPGQVYQDGRPYNARFGRSNISGGYAVVSVTSGSAVWGYASVVDAGTGDPTTVAMKSPELTAQDVVGDYQGTLTIIDSDCDPDQDGLTLEVRLQVTHDQGLLYEDICEKAPGESWECDDTKELLGPLEGDLVTYVWHENNLWFEPCMHVEHGTHELVFTGTTIRGHGTVSEHWEAENPEGCNDTSGDNFPCSERVEVDLVRCMDCWPPID